MSDNDRRAQYIANLRELADMLEANPSLPTPWYTHVATWADDAEAAREARKGINGWTKTNKADDAQYSYTKSIGGEAFSTSVVSYAIYVTKTETCERVQVGTRHVEAVEAHDEPVYEWVCGPDVNNLKRAEADMVPDGDVEAPF